MSANPLALPAELRDPVTVALWQLLHRRGQPESWDSNQTLAVALGRSIRTVQVALKRLKDAALIRVKQVRSRLGKGSRSHRRILLGPEPEPPLFAAQVRPSLPEPADNPPVCREPEPAPAEIAPTPPPEPAPTEVPAELVERAAQVLDAPVEHLAARLRAFAGRYTPAWIKAALDCCQKARERDGKVGVGYLVGTLKTFEAEGGPPPPKPVHPFDLMTREERVAYINRRLEELESKR